MSGSFIYYRYAANNIDRVLSGTKTSELRAKGETMYYGLLRYSWAVDTVIPALLWYDPMLIQLRRHLSAHSCTISLPLQFFSHDGLRKQTFQRHL